MTVRHCLYLTAFVAIATISDASSGWNYPSKGSAFVSGMPMQLRGRSGVVGLSSCAQRGDSAVDRRFFLASFALGLSGVLPAVSSAQQLSAKEAEEYAKLLEQAKRIQGVFDSQRAANEGVPGLQQPAPAAPAAPAAAAKTASPSPALSSSVGPSPKQSAVEAATLIMTALKANDDANNGLRTALKFASPENPVTKQPFDNFASQMQNGAYSVLMGRFDTFSVKKAEEYKEDGAEITNVDATVTAAYKTFMIAGMKLEYLRPVDKDTQAVTFRLQFRRSPDTGGAWLFDTLYLVAP